MKVLIFGASGQTGRELVEQALDSEHVVTAFARRPHMLSRTDGRLRVIQGDIIDVAAVARAVDGQEAVLSALGAPTPMRPYRDGVADALSTQLDASLVGDGQSGPTPG